MLRRQAFWKGTAEDMKIKIGCVFPKDEEETLDVKGSMTLTIPLPTGFADSADTLRRNRGRRGLDLLQEAQEDGHLAIRVDCTDWQDTAEADVKLLRLAQEVDGLVVTNDFNLNKVAAVSGMKVLNLNDLASALKPTVMAGEEMTVSITKEGKEQHQGVGYLDDGTMIVVEGGRAHVGETLPVIVTSVLQTSAGRMIFTKVK